MGELIFILIFSIPAIFGLAELIHILRSYILTPKFFTPKYSVIFLGKNMPYEQLLSAHLEFAWYGKKYAQNIIAVDCGINDENYSVCMQFCRKNNLIFCKSEELSDYMDVLMGKI